MLSYNNLISSLKCYLNSYILLKIILIGGMKNGKVSCYSDECFVSSFFS